MALTKSELAREKKKTKTKIKALLCFAELLDRTDNIIMDNTKRLKVAVKRMANHNSILVQQRYHSLLRGARWDEDVSIYGGIGGCINVVVNNNNNNNNNNNLNAHVTTIRMVKCIQRGLMIMTYSILKR